MIYLIDQQVRFSKEQEGTLQKKEPFATTFFVTAQKPLLKIFMLKKNCLLFRKKNKRNGSPLHRTSRSSLFIHMHKDIAKFNWGFHRPPIQIKKSMFDCHIIFKDLLILALSKKIREEFCYIDYVQGKKFGLLKKLIHKYI